MKKLLGILLSAVMIVAMIPMGSASAMESDWYSGGLKWSEDNIESSFNLAVGGTYTIPDWSDVNDYMCEDTDYEWNEELQEDVEVTKKGRYEIKTVSGTAGKVISINGNKIKGIGPGTVRVTFYSPYGEVLNDSGNGKNYITIHVRKVSFASTSKHIYCQYNENRDYYTEVPFKIKQDITKKSQIKISDGSNGYIEKIDYKNNKIYLSAWKKGTVTTRVNVEGKEFKLKVTLTPVKISKSNIVAYKGQKGAKLKVTSPKKLKKITFASTNKKVVTVGKKTGKLRYKGRGRAYVKVKANGKVVGKCLVEVTYKKAYLAVKNAYKDMNNSHPIKYSQAKRMKKYYRDCSSFASRCYWDSSLGRKLYKIGGKQAAKWALTAADQAKWLKNHGKTVGYGNPKKGKIPSVKKLLPGDMVYYETGYAGKNKRFRHIDHAAIYVGNGMIIDTVTELGSGVGKGDIDIRNYESDRRVSYVGRPLK